ncbi:MAG: hypothetical protein ACI4P7_04900 [Bacilli bacterium]
MSAKKGIRTKDDDTDLVNSYIANIKEGKTEESATNSLFKDVQKNLKLNKKEA